MSTAPHRHGRRPRGAFTLVEIMVVVVIIGLLAALAIPAFQRNQRASQNARAVNDFRVFAQSFEIHNSQNGGWPPNAGAGVVPVGMSGSFKVDAWTAPKNSLGGRWNWDYNRAEFVAGLSITNFTVNDAQLTEIDMKLDDGNLATGQFRKIAANRVTYILEQ
jgi:prepilin-type N-terminal cleavage/methylation domain-containing protein